MLKKFAAVLIISLGLAAAKVYGAEIYVNGAKVIFADVGPVNIDNRLLVPVRGVFESVGADIIWDAKQSLAQITYDNRLIQITAGAERLALKVGDEITAVLLDVPAQIIENRIMIPLRAAAEAMAATVEYYEEGGVYIEFESPAPQGTLAFTYKGAEYKMGDTAEQIAAVLGAPDREFSENYYTFYTYGSSEYEDYILFGFTNGKLTKALSVSKTFSAEGISIENGAAASASVYGYSVETYADKFSKIPYFISVTGSNAARLLNVSALSVSERERQVFDLTNAVRIRHGLAFLSWSDKLADVARAHSEDMSSASFFSHTNLSGLSPFDRMKNAGIRYYMAAENLAAGQKDAAQAMNDWMNSEGHRKNILTPELEELGVGVAISPEGRLYYTQNFAAMF